MLKLSDLDKIMKETIRAVDKGKNDVFEIAEGARNELARVEKQLIAIKEQTLEVIEQVDKAEKQEYGARKQLVHVSQNFKVYSEFDIRKAYEEASDKQVQTALLRQKESQLKEMRTELEFSYKNLKKTVAKAEEMVSKISVAIDYLGNNLKNVCDKLEEMEKGI